jgi:signal transduction histidine kinase/CheY-like chemotaxis protein
LYRFKGEFELSSAVVSILALIVAIAALVRAVTDHFYYKKRIRELQKRTLEAQRNLRRIGDMANEVAHEIKNPITAILCSAETLDMLIGKDLDDLHRKSLQYMKEYANHVLTLVSDFLDVSRAEAGKLVANPEAVAIANTVESIVGLLESNAIRKKIEIKKLVIEEDLQAYIDPRHFKQVLFNLIHNAIKFTPASGEVHIVMKCDFPEPFITVAVKDNGIGIAEEEIDFLFDPYATSKGPEIGVESGTGIGLALCKNLIEMAGGEILVTSSPGVGSNFQVKIPKYEKQDQEVGAALVEEGGSGERPLEGHRFLVIDEDNGSREEMSHLLEAWGGMVDRVELAIDAVNALEHKRYDAVMIDDLVDGVYALELAEMLREQVDLKNTTVIVATQEAVDPKLVRESSADGWIEKPFNGDALLSSLLKSGKYSITH